MVFPTLPLRVVAGGLRLRGTAAFFPLDEDGAGGLSRVTLAAGLPEPEPCTDFVLGLGVGETGTLRLGCGVTCLCRLSEVTDLSTLRENELEDIDRVARRLSVFQLYAAGVESNKE